MTLKNDIDEIRNGLEAGRYTNEASVSQGIVLKILNSLDWNVFDTSLVSPKYSVGSGRVDFTLCHPPGKPIILIESKDVGNAIGSEKQLFEYAFHQGIPMAILTDGQEWSFFLPGEQGTYHERCVYKLDLLARPIEECCHIFERYLKYSHVISGEAISNAKADYGNVSKKRQIEAALPQAWTELIKEQDEILFELIAEKVQTLCGFKPEPDIVREFLDSLQQPSTHIQVSEEPPQGPKSSQYNNRKISGFILNGKTYETGTAIKTLSTIFEVLSKRDPNFFEKYAALPIHGRKRRYLSRDKMELYPGREDLCKLYSQQLPGGWWMGINYSSSVIKHAIELACEVSGLHFGKDLILK